MDFPIQYDEEKLKKLYAAKGPIKNLQLPPIDKLQEAALALGAKEPLTAQLYSLLSGFAGNMDEVLGQVDYFKDFIKHGWNLGNLISLCLVSHALEGLNIYSEERQAIVDYCADLIRTEDQLLIFAKAREYGDDVTKALWLRINDSGIQGPGRRALRRNMMTFGLIDRKKLPKEDKLKLPKKLPTNLGELQQFHTALHLKGELDFKRGAKSVPDSWPEDIREIYLAYNGCGRREFEPIKEHKAMMSKMKWIMKDCEGDDFWGPESGEVDLRKHFHEDIIPIGSDANGDVFFADPRAMSKTGHPIIIRFIHDAVYIGSLEANSLAEFLARLCISQYQSSFGDDERLQKLEDHSVKIDKKKK